MIEKTQKGRRVEVRLVHALFTGAAALGLVACTTATEQEKPASEGRGALEHAGHLLPAHNLERLDRRVPGMRRASTEEVQLRFDRIAQARALAHEEASKPVDLDALLAKLATSTHRIERSALTNTYVGALAQLDESARAVAVTRLNETLAATPASSR